MGVWKQKVILHYIMLYYSTVQYDLLYYSISFALSYLLVVQRCRFCTGIADLYFNSEINTTQYLCQLSAVCFNGLRVSKALMGFWDSRVFRWRPKLWRRVSVINGGGVARARGRAGGHARGPKVGAGEGGGRKSGGEGS